MATKLKTIDPQKSQVSFEVKKLGLLTIKGTIADLTGEVAFDKDALEQAHFKVDVGTSTIDTGGAKRDEHLKGEDFFHVNDHQKISFQSTSVKKINDSYQATGKLSILGVTKDVSIPFSFSDGVFTGNFTINRLDYKLGKKFPAFFVGNTVQISIKSQLNN
jgi:polyisoprenoid-binding protein YceI